MRDHKSKSKEASMLDEIDRRGFMKMIGGGITIFFTVHLPASAQQRPPQGFGGMPRMGAAASDLNAYLRIGENGRVTVFSGKIEQGQSNTTALAQMAAEELGVSLDSIDMIMGDTDLCPWDMGTFGSMSIRIYGAALRLAAAEAKAILLKMASEQLNMPETQLKAENGIIYVTTDRKNQVTFAQLAKGQKITRKLEQKAAIKTPSEFTVIGKSPVRLDARAKITGAAKFAGDLRFPDLLYARVLRPPAHGATLKSVDTTEAEKIPGVTVIKEDGMIAVLHQDPETAEKARAAIKAEFDIPQSTLDPESIFDHVVKKEQKPQPAERRGDLAAGAKAAATLFEET
jgi:nicotinate dehydrogenase subunit B